MEWRSRRVVNAQFVGMFAIYLRSKFRVIYSGSLIIVMKAITEHKLLRLRGLSLF
jgi:hypothetical protein